MEAFVLHVPMDNTALAVTALMPLFALRNAKMTSMILMAIGLVSIICMFMFDKQPDDHHYHATRAWSNVFAGSFFFMAIALAAAFFLGLQYAAEAGWATTIKRIIECRSNAH